MNILLLNGSVAQKSHTKALLRYIEQLLKDKRVETVFWDLKAKPLPFVIPEYHRNPWDTPNDTVKEFVKVVGEADGIILGTPLYHGSYAGVLKNALDNLHLDAFRNKPLALVGNGSNFRAGSPMLDHLRLVVRTIYGYALQTQVGTNNSDYQEIESGYELINEDIKDRCQRLVDELVLFVKLLKSK